MQARKIQALGTFTAHLFTKDTFDDYELVEATFKTHSTFSIDGSICSEYYDEPPCTTFGTYGTYRPLCFEIIKGKRLPIAFKLVLKCSESQVKSLIADIPDYSERDIDGLFLNIRYENGSLTVITGTSLKTFSLDKTIEKAHDSNISTFFNTIGIEYEIL